MTNAQLAKALAARQSQWNEIAEATGVTYWTIRRIAQNANEPQPRTKAALVDYLDRERLKG